MFVIPNILLCICREKRVQLSLCSLNCDISLSREIHGGKFHLLRGFRCSDKKKGKVVQDRRVFNTSRVSKLAPTSPTLTISVTCGISCELKILNEPKYPFDLLAFIVFTMSFLHHQTLILNLYHQLPY